MVALKLRAGSQEAGFLSPICPINSVPAIVMIKNGTVQANLQSNEVSVESLQDRLITALGPREQLPVAEPSQSETSTAPSLSSPPQTEDSTTAEPEPVHDAEQDPGDSEPVDQDSGYLDLPPSEGRFRLPKNAYDALRSHTQSLVDTHGLPQEILDSQLSLLERLPIFRDEVKQLRSQASPRLSEAIIDRLLRLPAAAINAQSKPSASVNSETTSSAGRPVYSQQASTATTSAAPSQRPPSQQPARQSPPNYTDPGPAEPPNYSSSQHQAQRSDYIRLQKEREQAQRDERERIKAQIKADREERRRQEEVRKMNEAADKSVDTSTGTSAPTTKPRSTDVRIQVRTFDGSTLRTTLPPTSTVTADVRPWIDSQSDNALPYNLKLILTPLPNRNIEASEEEHSLSDLGIKGSCTMVMVPVKGYVESYTGNTPTGLVGSAVSGIYGGVTASAGALFGGVKSILGYGGDSQQRVVPGQTVPTAGTGENAGQQRNMRVRTLADQRVDDRERRSDQQFYNGNALNFAPNRDDDEEGRKDD